MSKAAERAILDRIEAVFANIPGWLPSDADARAKALDWQIDVIPRGSSYCYRRNRKGGITPCPYWARELGLAPEQGEYCAYLRRIDTGPESVVYPWDQMKTCDID